MIKAEARAGQGGNAPSGNYSETTIYIKSKRRHVTDLEAHLRALRQQLGMTADRFAKRIGISPASYTWIETDQREKVGRRNVAKVIDSLGQLTEENNPHAIGAVTLLTALHLDRYERRRINDLIDDAKFSGRIKFLNDKDPYYPPQTERRWYRVFNKNPFGKIIRYIKVTSQLTYAELAEESGVSKTQLLLMAYQKIIPGLPTVNQIIEWLAIDPQGKPAQLFRLKSQGRSSMPIESIKYVPLGMLVSYLRIAMGLTQPQLAKILKRVKATVHNIETTGRVRYPKDFDLWLGDEPINEIIQLRISNPSVPINDELLERVLSGKFLFVKEDFALAA